MVTQQDPVQTHIATTSYMCPCRSSLNNDCIRINLSNSTTVVEVVDSWVKQYSICLSITKMHLTSFHNICWKTLALYTGESTIGLVPNVSCQTTHPEWYQHMLASCHLICSCVPYECLLIKTWHYDASAKFYSPHSRSPSCSVHSHIIIQMSGDIHTYDWQNTLAHSYTAFPHCHMAVTSPNLYQNTSIC